MDDAYENKLEYDRALEFYYCVLVMNKKGFTHRSSRSEEDSRSNCIIIHECAGFELLSRKTGYLKECVGRKSFKNYSYSNEDQ
jgi:hypothetical protein